VELVLVVTVVVVGAVVVEVGAVGVVVVIAVVVEVVVGGTVTVEVLPQDARTNDIKMRNVSEAQINPFFM
jgi:predicted signal transduction protein with EAL and GGDEF domain